MSKQSLGEKINAIGIAFKGWLVLNLKKSKSIFLKIKYFLTSQYKNGYYFLIEENNKKEILSSYFQKYYEKFKKCICTVFNFLHEHVKKFTALLFRQINKNEKLSHFFKKWLNTVKESAHEIKKLILKKYQECREYLRQYEWYQQVMEASRPEDRKITLITSFFTNLLALAFPMSLMQIYDRVIPHQSYSTLVVLSIGVTIAIFLEMTLRILRSNMNLWADAKYEYVLSTKAFLNLLHMPLYLYENTDMGTRIKQFAVLDQMRGFYNNQFMALIFDIPFLLIFLIAIFYIGGWLVLTPIFLGVILVIASFRYIENAKDTLEKKLTLESRENDFLVNVLGNIHTAKALAMENLLIRRYERMQNTSVEVNYDSVVHTGDLDSIKSIFTQIGIVSVGAIGTIFVLEGNMAVGSLIACILLTGRFMVPLVRSVAAIGRWKMINIIRHQLDVVLAMHTEEKPVLQEIQGDIELKNLSYLSKSDGVTHWVVQNANIQISAHTMVAIIGDSKHDVEKLLNVIAGITRPTEGEYLIDNKNVDQLKNYVIRNKIAYLSNNGTLFQGTIMDNLSAFNSDLIPDAERYAGILDLEKIVLRLPFGYDTPVGDKTVVALPTSVVNLIYVIRSLVNKPKIILLDQASIDLDENVTTKLIALLKILKQSATIIVVSADKATEQLVDVVYELKQSQIRKA